MGLPTLLRFVQIASGNFGNPVQATVPLPPKNAGQTGMATGLWLPWMYRDAYLILYRKGEVSVVKNPLELDLDLSRACGPSFFSEGTSRRVLQPKREPPPALRALLCS